MFKNLEIFKMASGLASHAANRHSLIAQNIAHADTPGYRSRDVVSFSDSYRPNNSGLEMRSTRAGHIMANTSGAALQSQFETNDPVSPNGNSVSLETEMVRASEVQLQHELALSIYSKSLSILRSSLGRG